MKKQLFVYIIALLFCSCQQSEKETLPPASGSPGSIYVVMGSTQWKGPLGRTIDSLLSVDISGLPRPEPLFDVQWIDPAKLNFVLKRHRNLIFAFTLDKATSGVRKVKNFFSKASLKNIQNHSEKHITAVTDVYARDQEVMYLYGKTEEALIANIRHKGQRLVNRFEKREKERVLKSLLRGGHMKGVLTWLKKNFGCHLKIPSNYKLVEATNDFLWARQINPKSDKNIFIARTNYTSPHQLDKQEIIAFRNQVCKQHLFEDPELPNSYLTTETTIPFMPVNTKKVRLNGRYAVQLSGLWRTNNFSMGGPFIGYTVIDQPKGKLYYIEGFVFSPGEDQREIIRQLGAILSTFKPEDNTGNGTTTSDSDRNR